ncbi:glycosyltransferase family 2 protein [Thalassotalea piscium]|uniref:Glycosyltransferase involved in cell wall biosynthesis n=1 Tax=Thalassotalea piscium TaxID=1230533 RepID=A0A7X0TT10_9GAMM|nr:glycosyltransferase [Thalassotalea piscium]MBB6542747.1 glycosyltransferase involved in cell wall biosynthesis [Thalassotalea piscium]
MTSKTLTLAFACIGERLPSLLESLTSIESHARLHIIILVQKPLTDTLNIVSAATENIIILDNIGLSKSRNAAITNANSDYIWFLDDDVQITNQDITAALAIIDKGNADFYRVKIGCIEWHDKTFKKYEPINKPNKLHLLKISSIEIIANLNFIKSKRIKFNESIGLGTKYQCNEENNFLIDAWEQGARFKFIDKVLIRHTCIFEGRVLATDKIFEIRGATASRYHVFGILLMLRWSVRYLLKEKKLSYIRALFKGYFKGYNNYRENPNNTTVK